jgi:maltose alpha-D-glucosyltransferase / alpha-amylase
MIHARRGHPAFGLGTFLDLGGTNPSVLSYAREHDPRHEGGSAADIIVCVNNLSRFAQPVELDLRRWEGYTPIELLGGVPFPPIGELPYLLTLGGYGFYWFRLTAPPEEATTP